MANDLAQVRDGLLTKIVHLKATTVDDAL